uniref:Uncharacterized protein n=1 Tax=Anguilla anguilla TaxID=7936 RepID=A0A0E9TZ20_ANGAN
MCLSHILYINTATRLCVIFIEEWRFK